MLAASLPELVRFRVYERPCLKRPGGDKDPRWGPLACIWTCNVFTHIHTDAHTTYMYTLHTHIYMHTCMPTHMHTLCTHTLLECVGALSPTRLTLTLLLAVTFWLRMCPVLFMSYSMTCSTVSMSSPTLWPILLSPCLVLLCDLSCSLSQPPLCTGLLMWQTVIQALQLTSHWSGVNMGRKCMWGKDAFPFSAWMSLQPQLQFL